ncbi:hypothetical protein GCM10009802_31370 [Streptomyces synnematoformans]|uniref:Uncharacterized protein n=1 Tax=Streptomyces synnematoformans TaxID=415721 RepID=A0ABN2YE61_9ACTN
MPLPVADRPTDPAGPVPVYPAAPPAGPALTANSSRTGMAPAYLRVRVHKQVRQVRNVQSDGLWRPSQSEQVDT